MRKMTKFEKAICKIENSDLEEFSKKELENFSKRLARPHSNEKVSRENKEKVTSLLLAIEFALEDLALAENSTNQHDEFLFI